MKFLIKATVPTEIGNKLMKDGSMMRQLQAYFNDIKPEAVYFTIGHGKRMIIMIVEMQSADKIPEIAEPLWLDWNAEVHIKPVMDANDFEKAGASIQRIVAHRK